MSPSPSVENVFTVNSPDFNHFAIIVMLIVMRLLSLLRSPDVTTQRPHLWWVAVGSSPEGKMVRPGIVMETEGYSSCSCIYIDL